MNDQPHVETTPEPTPEQAADVAALESLAGDIDGAGFSGDAPETEPEPPAIPTRKLIEPLVSLFCASVAPAWAITSAEQEQLAEAYAAVVDKYFPGGMPMGPEVGAVMITIAVVMPRLGQPMKPEPEPEPEKPGATSENK